MTGRESVLRLVADAIRALPADGVRRVGIDGVDAAGKTRFADDLAAVLVGQGERVTRVGLDGFHQPRSRRYRRGRDSPEGFYRDSFDLRRVCSDLLDPLSPGGGGRFRRAVWDLARDVPQLRPVEQAEPGDILVLDGVFLHRPQLRSYWDYSVFLEVAFEVSVPRMARRDGGSPDLQAASNRRYVEGQRLYLAECAPRHRASVVIDHNDVLAPVVIATRGIGRGSPEPG